MNILHTGLTKILRLIRLQPKPVTTAVDDRTSGSTDVSEQAQIALESLAPEATTSVEILPTPLAARAAIATGWSHGISGSTVVAWSFKPSDDVQAQAHTMPNGDADPQHRRSLVFDALADVIAAADASGMPVRLFIDDPMIRTAVAAMGSSFPQIVIQSGWPQNQATKCAVRAVALAEATVVATDASIGLDQPGAGLACVSDSGRVTTAYHPLWTDITRAELQAIVMALRSHSGNLVIISDSQSAVSWANGECDGVDRFVALTDEVRQLCKGRFVEIRWQKGHVGHPLNEAADRKAKGARRSAQRARAGQSQRPRQNKASALQTA